MRRTALGIALGAAVTLTAGACQAAPAKGCAGDNGGITLSPGFCATVFADNLGHIRHIAFALTALLTVAAVNLSFVWASSHPSLVIVDTIDDISPFHSSRTGAQAGP